MLDWDRREDWEMDGAKEVEERDALIPFPCDHCVD
jgi:hypothetical protein